MNVERKALPMIALTCMAAWLIPNLFGQTDATILGTVKDESGAVLPGVMVTVKSLETGSSRTAITDETGIYRVPQLAVGNYEVQAELAGFQTAVRQGILLTLGREALVDFTLKVGAVSEKVTVTGDAPIS